MDIVTTAQAAKALGISIVRVQQLINAGRLPAQKLGRYYVIRRKDLALVKVRKVGRPRKKK